MVLTFSLVANRCNMDIAFSRFNDSLIATPLQLRDTFSDLID